MIKQILTVFNIYNIVSVKNAYLINIFGKNENIQTL